MDCWFDGASVVLLVLVDAFLLVDVEEVGAYALLLVAFLLLQFVADVVELGGFAYFLVRLMHFESYTLEPYQCAVHLRCLKVVVIKS